MTDETEADYQASLPTPTPRTAGGTVSSIWTKDFWKATGERAIKTVAQSGISTLTVVSLAGGGVTEVAWGAAGSIAALAGLLSVFSSIATNGATGNGPGVGDAEVIADQV